MFKEIVLVRAYDWEGLYVGGLLQTVGHEIEIDSLVRHLTGDFPAKLTIVTGQDKDFENIEKILDERNGFPPFLKSFKNEATSTR